MYPKILQIGQPLEPTMEKAAFPAVAGAAARLLGPIALWEGIPRAVGYAADKTGFSGLTNLLGQATNDNSALQAHEQALEKLPAWQRLIYGADPAGAKDFMFHKMEAEGQPLYNPKVDGPGVPGALSWAARKTMDQYPGTSSAATSLAEGWSELNKQDPKSLTNPFGVGPNFGSGLGKTIRGLGGLAQSYGNAVVAGDPELTRLNALVQDPKLSYLDKLKAQAQMMPGLLSRGVRPDKVIAENVERFKEPLGQGIYFGQQADAVRGASDAPLWEAGRMLTGQPTPQGYKNLGQHTQQAGKDLATWGGTLLKNPGQALQNAWANPAGRVGLIGAGIAGIGFGAKALQDHNERTAQREAERRFALSKNSEPVHRHGLIRGYNYAAV